MYEYQIENRVPVLFALSTCPRCNRMKEFLQFHKVEALIVDVDRLMPHEKTGQLEFLRQVNPTVSMPTLVVGDQVVVGEDYEGVRKVLDL